MLQHVQRRHPQQAALANGGASGTQPLASLAMSLNRSVGGGAGANSPRHNNLAALAPSSQLNIGSQTWLEQWGQGVLGGLQRLERNLDAKLSNVAAHQQQAEEQRLAARFAHLEEQVKSMLQHHLGTMLTHIKACFFLMGY